MARLAPWLMLMYVVSFLDRANVSFAKQALAATEGITESAYAMGAGLFFIGYSSCGFPSNLILHRIGAKIWIAFLMVTWGLVSMATMFVSGSTSFYVLRLLLGATEAGFFPGIILYLTYWFPRRVRGQMLGLFYLGVPLALIVGGPLSGWLLDTAYLASFKAGKSCSWWKAHWPRCWACSLSGSSAIAQWTPNGCPKTKSRRSWPS